jgi:hypothetical protein
MIGITFSISWYTFYDSPLISKKSKVAVWFWEHKKSPNLQSIVLGWGQILLAERPRGVEQPRKKLECIGKRAECIENSPHPMNTTPGFRSILACGGPQRGGGIFNFPVPDFSNFPKHTVPRIRYTWYALVFAVLPVAQPHLRDVTFRCSPQYRCR